MGLLDGYRLLDLSRLAPGPNASRLLADMGMEVIKVEEPEQRGGFDRDTLTPANGSPDEHVRWAAYNVLARNKQSIAINLKHEPGRQIFYRLVTTADVVLEGYRPGVAERLGVGYPKLSELNPMVIYCSLSLVGQDGPHSGVAGHDAQAQAITGMLALGSDEEGNPRHSGYSTADHGGALHAVVGILAALLGRPKLGKGQYIDVAMSDSLLSFVPTFATQYLRDGVQPARGEGWPYHLTVLKCKDGRYISTQNAETYFWERFCYAIGREDLIPYRRATEFEYPRVVREIRSVMLTKTRDEWLDILRKADTCVAPVHEFGRGFDDPQNVHRGATWELDHPVVGKVRQLGFPIKFSETPGEFRTFAPELGEHTIPILERIGYGQSEIDVLLANGTVKASGT